MSELEDSGLVMSEGLRRRLRERLTEEWGESGDEELLAETIRDLDGTPNGPIMVRPNFETIELDESLMTPSEGTFHSIMYFGLETDAV